MKSGKQKIDLSGTHLPVLSILINRTDGAVLEMGAGFNSTPLLYWACKAQDRMFRSYENDKVWCEMLGDFTTYIKDWEKAPIDDKFWSLAFIDHRPALRRHKEARRLKDNANFIVMHDSEPEIDKFYKYTWIYKHFKFRYDFKKIKPNTVVLSNFLDPKYYFGIY